MFFGQKNKKLKEKFSLEDNVVVFDGEFSIVFKVDDILKTIKISEKYECPDMISKLVGMSVQKQLNKDFYNNKISKQKIMLLHNNLINNGTFDIWNNNVFYHQHEETVLEECLAYILDYFSNRYKSFANASVDDIYYFLNRKASLDDISIFETETFRDKHRTFQLFHVVKFLTNLSDKYLDIEKFNHSGYNCELYGINACKYDFSKTFQENVNYKIVNHKEFKDALDETAIKIYFKHSSEGEDLIKEENLYEVYFGKYIDYKSLHDYMIFLNIPELNDRYLPSILDIAEDGDPVLSLFVFDDERKEPAFPDVYKHVLKILSKP